MLALQGYTIGGGILYIILSVLHRTLGHRRRA